MQSKRGDDARTAPTEPALRVIMRRLREIMAEPGDGQSRLDKIVRQIAGLMVAEVCSIYLKRQDGSLELFATEGLNPEAVHTTRLNRGEGLVGRCAELGIPINEPEAQKHPAFSRRPETGEEIYHSLLAVPIQRSGVTLGVIVVQNKTPRVYSDEDVEVLQATTMVIAEQLASGAVAGASISDHDLSTTTVIKGEPISEGIALGHVVLHEPRVVVTDLLSSDPDLELSRLEAAHATLHETLDDMMRHEALAKAGAHREVLEAYRMFASDKGWLKRMRDAVAEGLTAEAAVERVKNTTRARMLRVNEPFWRERLRDLDDLSDRLLRILAGRTSAAQDLTALPSDTVLVARTMGPAELLDYDRVKLRGLIIEDGSGQSHVAIVARALGVAAVGQAKRIVERVSNGDSVIVDAESGEIHLRPSAEVITAYSDKVRFRARRQQRYLAFRDKPAVTLDGASIKLHINAGLLVDLPHLQEAGADGIGLFRTELQFMVSDTLPRLETQADIYRQILDQAGGKRVVFRALDVGGDKALPYLKHPAEENPALGWRAVRLLLDRPALLRLQLRALFLAAGGREIDFMLPMVTAVSEIDAARQSIKREADRIRSKGGEAPRLRLGAMIEVPGIVYELDKLLPKVDFISVGSNDLMQFTFAADRGNPKIASRYDALSVAALRVLKTIVTEANRFSVPVTLCGEMAGRPLESMALVGLGYRSLSMPPASVGPIKAMIRSLDAGRIASRLDQLMSERAGSLRSELESFARNDGVEI
ncbi:MAG: phosphoenolpyruvate--protein phosphotransferase [Hyphomicrobiaceae bacterium]